MTDYQTGFFIGFAFWPFVILVGLFIGRMLER